MKTVCQDNSLLESWVKDSVVVLSGNFSVDTFVSLMLFSISKLLLINSAWVFYYTFLFSLNLWQFISAWWPATLEHGDFSIYKYLNLKNSNSHHRFNMVPRPAYVFDNVIWWNDNLYIQIWLSQFSPPMIIILCWLSQPFYKPSQLANSAVLYVLY